MSGFTFTKPNLTYRGPKTWRVDDGPHRFAIKSDKIFFQYLECTEECHLTKVRVKNGNALTLYECIRDVEAEGDFDSDASNDGSTWIFDITFGDIELLVPVEEIRQAVTDRKDQIKRTLTFTVEAKCMKEIPLLDRDTDENSDASAFETFTTAFDFDVTLVFTGFVNKQVYYGVRPLDAMKNFQSRHRC